MTTKFAAAAFAAATLAAAGSANAATVSWADWTGDALPINTAATHADGTITVGSDVVDVAYDGAIWFTQTNGGADYWADNGYTQGVVNRPTGSDIVALNAGGQKTITFSQAVVDPYIAFTSWNGNVVNFSAPFTVVSQGCGYWGCGSFSVNGTSTGFTGSGEVHGVLQFQGTFTSITFTDTSEGWHGFTVGIGGIAQPPGVPEPATWAMMILGFGAAGSVLRRRRTVAA
ncbi:PEPxxWA-CTERM sorting domain-containing protein [Phenylobacterium sp.]|uniref:PEPxxWA-CTERM sorting domain-containing protein n=1 Tax=Phenylobacterium sp. TaxID=1871053 RepID=UPI0025E4C811|nr:PEPxxWA-CTERM sorting domain-containing protein [Phenylobacterium sp.]MBX3482577.1 PEP-CTERM sorting domain-containing protein [Phenylobacterium sp.]MCW5759605.1 PEP-CTERM sorting domain-containing protein [Phenylobacterium sp.]